MNRPSQLPPLAPSREGTSSSRRWHPRLSRKIHLPGSADSKRLTPPSQTLYFQHFPACLGSADSKALTLAKNSPASPFFPALSPPLGNCGKQTTYNPCRIRTYKKSLRNSFRIRTYKKPGGGVRSHRSLGSSTFQPSNLETFNACPISFIFSPLRTLAKTEFAASTLESMPCTLFCKTSPGGGGSACGAILVIIGRPPTGRTIHAHD